MTAGRKRKEYLSFRTEVAATFLSLKGTPSTQYCFECERLLCETHFPRLEGRRLLKTDLWDEAEKTEILLWAAQRGARPLGIDMHSISRVWPSCP